MAEQLPEGSVIHALEAREGLELGITQPVGPLPYGNLFKPNFLFKSCLATATMNVFISHPSSPRQSLFSAAAETSVALTADPAANLSNTADSLSVSKDPLTYYEEKVYTSLWCQVQGDHGGLRPWLG